MALIFDCYCNSPTRVWRALQVTGNTIFNLLSISDVETDAQDRPLHPPKLLSVEVLWNPFEDIVPR